MDRMLVVTFENQSRPTKGRRRFVNSISTAALLYTPTPW